MTYSSYMMTISISNLKAHLSATLKAVRKGEKYTVMDRDYPRGIAFDCLFGYISFVEMVVQKFQCIT